MKQIAENNKPINGVMRLKDHKNSSDQFGGIT